LALTEPISIVALELLALSQVGPIQMGKGAARRAQAAVRHLQAAVSLSGTGSAVRPGQGAFRPGPGGCPAGPVTPSPRSVAASAGSTRRRAATNMHGVAERTPSCDRQRSWRCLRDRRTTGFPQIRAVRAVWRLFWLAMRVGATGG
jgi:hypothetical protein